MVTTGGRDSRSVVDVGRIEQAFLDVGFGDALDRMAHFLGDELRRVGVDHIGDLVHLALLHQQADDVDRALRHAVGEFLDGDRFRQRDLAGDLFLLLGVAETLQALHPAAEGGDGARALVFALPLVAVVTVRRPRFFASPPRDGVGRGGERRREAADGADGRRA